MSALPNSGGWQCPACTFAVPVKPATQCSMCGTPVVGESTWTCSACTLLNEQRSGACTACNTKRPALASASAGVAAPRTAPVLSPPTTTPAAAPDAKQSAPPGRQPAVALKTDVRESLARPVISRVEGGVRFIRTLSQLRHGITLSPDGLPSKDTILRVGSLLTCVRDMTAEFNNTLFRSTAQHYPTHPTLLDCWAPIEGPSGKPYAVSEFALQTLDDWCRANRGWAEDADTCRLVVGPLFAAVALLNDLGVRHNLITPNNCYVVSEKPLVVKLGPPDIVAPSQAIALLQSRAVLQCVELLAGASDSKILEPAVAFLRAGGTLSLERPGLFPSLVRIPEADVKPVIFPCTVLITPTAAAGSHSVTLCVSSEIKPQDVETLCRLVPAEAKVDDKSVATLKRVTVALLGFRSGDASFRDTAATLVHRVCQVLKTSELEVDAAGSSHQVLDAVLAALLAKDKSAPVPPLILPPEARHLPSSLWMYPQVEIANLQDCARNMLDPPMATCLGGMEAVRTYLHDQVGSLPLRECQCILLGDGEAGKTTLREIMLAADEKGDIKQQQVKAILGIARRQTLGIETVTTKVAGASGPLTLNVWDFQGQAEAWISHNYFLTEIYAVCLLVCDFNPALCTSPDLDILDHVRVKARFWLGFLASKFEDKARVRVMLVASHVDVFEAQQGVWAGSFLEAVQRDMQREFPSLQIEACATVKYDNPATIATFVTRLAATAEGLIRDTKISKSYNVVKEFAAAELARLRGDKKCPLVPRTELDRACLQLGPVFQHSAEVKKENPPLHRRALEYLHNCGRLLAFSDLSHNILEVEWLAKIIARFVVQDQIPALLDKSKKRGIVDYSVLQGLLSSQSKDFQFNCSPNDVPPVVETLIKLRLCIDISDPRTPLESKQFLFPCLAPQMTRKDRADQWPKPKSVDVRQAGRRYVREGLRVAAASPSPAPAPGPAVPAPPKLSILPGFFNVLQVKLLRLPGVTVDYKIIRRDSLVLRYSDSASVLVELEKDSCHIDVIAQGPEPAALLRPVTAAIDELCSEFPFASRSGSKMAEQLLCFDCIWQPWEVDAKTQDLLAANRTHYSCAFLPQDPAPVCKITKAPQRTNAMVQGFHKVPPTIKFIPSEALIVSSRLLGKGNFGRVQEGTYNGHPVAVKTTTSTPLPQQLQELENNVSIPPHRNVVEFIGVSSDVKAGCLKLVAHVSGSSVETLLERNAALIQTPAMLRKLALDCLYGLQHLHDNGIVARDLSARNVLFNDRAPSAAEHRFQLCDWGLSRKVDKDKRWLGLPGSEVPYGQFAPESLSGHIFGFPSDVWQFGVMMWEATSDMKANAQVPIPFDADETNLDLVKAGHLVLALSPICPKPLRQIVCRCWEFDPLLRPTVKQLIELITAWTP